MPSHRAQGQPYFITVVVGVVVVVVVVIVTIIVIITTFHKAPHNLTWTILDFR
jgi:predicted signal transduction protein with EAL and GGDEF domain